MKLTVLPGAIVATLLLAGCSSQHRLAGVWTLDKALERKTIEENAPMGTAAQVPQNPAVADDVTISLTSHKITWMIEAGGGVRYDEYNYTVKKADPHSVAVSETNTATGASQDAVYHFETDGDREIMWTSDPVVNKAMGIELRLYFSRPQ